ncbi:formate dehydrogenase accessory sulfurtransferase FdhD [uncultured Thiothrix sp.]|uniref:formate dehydrogenase accessory sulfurtransferase FdhD n=1 Tax=uncultured Thiothrix sp. TaxID=223185 RepID=UPI00260D9BC1|nr:formate dehydrogenase accessory sulfurtransferase FdhD [uncultured Thiothrix sp.]HMT93096.1 formate dehydrogenase accessory sulfurtransferase FdhD [Thiolinea sp.]
MSNSDFDADNLATIQAVVARRYVCGEWSEQADQIAEEVPLALIYNGIAHAVMLGTPADLADFALGFSLTEGIISEAKQLRDLEVVKSELGLEIYIDIASEAFHGFKVSRRQLAGRTGCGLCGQETLQQAIRPIPKVGHTLKLQPQAFKAALNQLPEWQTMHQTTGGVHAAAWVDIKGNIQALREDVGRHNALDKLLGALFKHDFAPDAGFLLLTSRASHELVYKAAFAGIELIAAVSAPTSLALRHAEEAGLTLVGWLRKGGFSVYSGAGRCMEMV